MMGVPFQKRIMLPNEPASPRSGVTADIPIYRQCISRWTAKLTCRTLERPELYAGCVSNTLRALVSIMFMMPMPPTENTCRSGNLEPGTTSAWHSSLKWAKACPDRLRGLLCAEGMLNQSATRTFSSAFMSTFSRAPIKEPSVVFGTKIRRALNT